MTLKLRHILIIILSAFVMTSCYEDDTMLTDEYAPEIPTIYTASKTRGLLQNADGTWSAKKRVPLVGMGRVVDDYTNGSITVGTVNSKIQNITDCDLTNYASFGAGLADVSLATVPVVSVRDLNHTYAAGTKVGIVFKSPNSGLLTLDLLKFFSIHTKYTPADGEKTEDCEISSGSSGSGLLGLSLINVGGDSGMKEISFTTTKKFNEVQFWVNGVDVKALAGAGIDIYYAFVGDNEIQHAVRGSKNFPDAKLDERLSWTRMPGQENIVDADITNCAAFELLTGLLSQPCATVDFGREIPAGWEVGFEISNTELLTLGTGTKLETYDATGNEPLDKVVEAKVLGLNLQVGAHRRLSLIATKPLRKVRIIFPTVVKLGVTQVFYAYARPKVELDPSSIFSMPSEINIKNDFLALPMPQGGTTTWNVISGPASATISVDKNTGTTKLRGMKADGEYIIMGSFTPNAADQGSAQPIQVITKVNRTAEKNIGYELITSSKHGAVNDEHLPDIVTGGLIPLEFISNQDNIIDQDPYSYASFGGLELAANKAIANISWRGHPAVNADCKKVRAGFILQTSFNFLNADALNVYRVLLYNNEERVADSKGLQGEGLKGLKVGLINVRGEQSKLFVETDKSFNRMVLMTSGVLNLSAGRTRIYGAFWESADKNVVGIDEAGVEYLDYIQHNAEIDYDWTYIGEGVASVGGTFTDLAKAIDHNGDSYTVNGGLNVATGSSIAIKFNPITTKTPQRIGMVTKNTGGLSLDLINSYKISLYHNKKPLKGSDGKNLEITVGGGLLELDLKANPERIFSELTLPANSTVDEICISGGEAVTLNNGLKVLGAYVRLDDDGDGIPDGTEDNETPETDPNEEKPLVTDLISARDVCEPGEVKLHVKKYIRQEDGTFILKDAPLDGNYSVKYADLSAINSGVTVIPSVKLSQGSIFTIKDLKAGKYQFAVKLADNDKTYSNAVDVTIHPLYTEWKTNPIDTDWNNWDNWTKGSPWSCTNVVIPGVCEKFPVLKDITGNGYYARNVHFEAGAELIYPHRLEYKKAWVEMYVPAGYNFLLSAPLKEMVTGDMFIPAAMHGSHKDAAKFENLNLENCKDDRFHPRVFQRFWNQTVTGKIISGHKLEDKIVTCDETDWSKSFNAVAEPYDAGTGFKMMAARGANSSGEYYFRFPKTHDYYSYFDGSGNNTGQAEEVYRKKELIGRFIFEQPGTSKSGKWEYKVTLANTQKASTIFAAGNPLMAHIDISKFLEANPNIKDVKLYDGNTFSTMSRHYRTPGNTGIIAPMQGFMVSVESPSTSLDITFNEAMQIQASGIGTASVSQRASSVPTRASKRFAVTNKNDLSITASCGGLTSSCIVSMNAKADDGYKNREDSKLLYDRDFPPAAAVFTIADGKALEYQQCSTRREIPLGLRMAEPGEVSLLFMFKAGGKWSGWALEDRLTGKVYPFGSGSAYVTLHGTDTETARYYLIKK